MSASRIAEPQRRIAATRLPVAPLLVAGLAHAIALGAVFLLPAIGFALPLPLAALMQGVAASALGRLLGLPLWWMPINLLFLPASLLVMGQGLAPHWYLAAFVALGLLFWSTLRTRVPLYLSSREACRALLRLIPAGNARVLDLGCGFGGLLSAAAAARPEAQFVGLELAPAPSLVAWLRLRRLPNARAVHGDFWKHDLGSYDLVYAFLSPVAMAPLWQMARAQMKPGSLLVSNSFAIQGVAPDQVIALPGRDSRALYVWRM